MTLQSATSVQRPLRIALRWLLVSLVAALLTVMTVQIVMRYGFNSSLLWAEEMCRYMLIWLTFLAVVLAFERGEIAAIGFLASALPRVPALLVTIFGISLSLLLCILLAWYGWIYAERAGQSSIPAVGFILESIFGSPGPAAPGRFWVYVSLPLGMALVALRLVADLVICIRAIGAGQSVEDIFERDMLEVME
jgi:TRAP-type C4-dicarboxylate transport system permease small subunit